MEFEDQDEHEGEEEQEDDIELPSSYESFGNSGRPKMPSPVGVGLEAPPQTQRKPRYRECLKNHAVGIGGHAVDGCGEFLASGADGSLAALKCAACNCHRNFHRKEPDSGCCGAVEPISFGGHHQYLHPHHHQLLTHHPHGQFSSPFYRTPSGYLHVTPQTRPLALPSSSGGGLDGCLRDEQDVSNPNYNSGGFPKKRFRSKFTPEQKEKMLSLAERLDWRIQKQDEEIVQQFCNETGVKRQVLKVWMHNNKHTLGKKPYNSTDNTTAS